MLWTGRGGRWNVGTLVSIVCDSRDDQKTSLPVWEILWVVGEREKPLTSNITSNRYETFMGIFDLAAE